MAQIAYQRRSLVEFGGFESMLEVNGHAGPASGDLEQVLVEPMTRDRIDQFVGPLSVGLKGGTALEMMNEPPAHRQERVLQFLENARHLQGVDAAIRERQIDGPARVSGSLSGVRASFVEFHVMAATLQQYREERPSGTRADDANRGASDLHRRRACDKA